MAIAIFNIGTDIAASSSPAVNAPAGGIPSGALIVVCAGEGSTRAGTVSDSVGNSYTRVTQLTHPSATINGSLHFANNITALSSSNTITYNEGGTAVTAVMSAVYLTGQATASQPDSAVNASTTGASSNPSLASGTPTATDMLIGMVVSQFSTGYTQDTGNGWANPPNFAGPLLQIALGGGSQISTASKTYAPTLQTGLTPNWVEIISGFTQATATTVTMFYGYQETIVPSRKFEVIGY